jgi:hypothetical protein
VTRVLPRGEHVGSAARLAVAGALGVLVLSFTGCGGKAPAATLPLALLVRSGDMPGFVGSRGEKITNLPAAFAASGPNVVARRRRRQDVAALRDEGFVVGGTKRVIGTHGKREAIGISIGIVFESARGALGYRARYLRRLRKPLPGISIELRSVPGIPDGRVDLERLKAAEKGGRGGAVNLVFASGRCAVVIADAAEHKLLLGPVLAAARAVYRRTLAACR